VDLTSHLLYLSPMIEPRHVQNCHIQLFQTNKCPRKYKIQFSILLVSPKKYRYLIIMSSSSISSTYIYIYINYVLCENQGLLWSWSYGSLINEYLCNQCISPLTLWVRIPLMRGVPDTTLCAEGCWWLAAGQWFSPGTPVFSTNKTDRHDIIEYSVVSGVKHHNP
jgi:hypothetical protein